MVAGYVIDQQLRDIGAIPRFLGRPELRELSNILFDGEIIRHLIIGRYEGGWATLCATDRRVLLVDKKPFYLTIEDVRYDMVSDVEYNYRLLNGSVCLGTIHKTIRFISYNHQKLRALTNYVQEQVMHVRSQPGQATEPHVALVSDRSQPSYVPVPYQQRSAITMSEQAPPEEDTSTILAQMQAPPVSRMPQNPYKKSPVIMRRHISRFYGR